jgi:hypothetical protein
VGGRERMKGAQVGEREDGGEDGRGRGCGLTAAPPPHLLAA